MEWESPKRVTKVSALWAGAEVATTTQHGLLVTMGLASQLPRLGGHLGIRKYQSRGGLKGRPTSCGEENGNGGITPVWGVGTQKG